MPCSISQDRPSFVAGYLPSERHRGTESTRPQEGPWTRLERTLQLVESSANHDDRNPLVLSTSPVVISPSALCVCKHQFVDALSTTAAVCACLVVSYDVTTILR